MAIVIPRAFSSGALSIESNARYFTLGFAFDSTLVIAAVSVVFPWSMCPIVPTFMCGLDRSNFSLAIADVSVSTIQQQTVASSALGIDQCLGELYVRNPETEESLFSTSRLQNICGSTGFRM